MGNIRITKRDYARQQERMVYQRAKAQASEERRQRPRKNMVKKTKSRGSKIVLGNPSNDFELKIRRLEDRQKVLEAELRKRRFRDTKTGKAGTALRRFGLAQQELSNYNRSLGGRPRGSFDKRYAKFGGVYGYRKVLNEQLRQRRLQSQRDANLTPQQQAILNQMEARRRASQMNPENRTIPDTRGEFDFDDITREIGDASDLVP